MDGDVAHGHRRMLLRIEIQAAPSFQDA